jgi:hypothetical protein
MDAGEGVRAGRIRRRQRIIISVLGLLGTLTIGAMVTFGRLHYGLPPGHVPAGAAIAGAVLLPALFVAVEWGLWRSTDEVDRLAALRASRIALYLYFNAQLSLVLLRQGGIIGRVDDLLLMIGIGIFFLATYQILKRVR